MSTVTEAPEVLEKLGGGPMFEVWLVRDERHGLAVCKQPRPSAERGRALRRMRREARLLEQLSHRAIPKLLAAELDVPRPRLVLEYLRGPNLAQRLRRGPLDAAATARLGADIADALHELHSRHLVHLDVKPANIVLSAGGWLIDFSLSRSLERARSLVLPVGTRGYMAPEISRAGPPGRVGCAVDVWGLGATLYEAFSGRPPLQEGRFDLAPEPLPVPAAMSKAVLACLARDARSRPQAAEVASALRASC